MIVRRLLRLEKLSTRRKVRAETEAIAGAFDPDFYLENNPDVARYPGSPLEHFVRHGWREGRDPAPGFSVKGYLLANPDVAEAGVNPFWHYVVAGREEGRALVVGKSDGEAEAVSPDGMSSAQIAAEIRGFFDEEFYLSNNPDVRSNGMDPIDHFVLFGWQEGRNPSDSFSVDYYLQTNADVREAGLNPFWHYVVAGRTEGRHPRHPGGHAADRLVQTQPLEETIAVNCPLLEPATETTGGEIASAILNAKGSSELVVSIGHDNYRNVAGGVQFCIQQEEEIAQRRGVQYLNLHPFRPLPRLAHGAETPDI